MVLSCLNFAAQFQVPAPACVLRNVFYLTQLIFLQPMGSDPMFERDDHEKIARVTERVLAVADNG